MASRWELICHHTYAGVPTVIPDLSPAGRSHGRGIGLLPSDYLSDGQKPGSGAVSLVKHGSYVHVRLSQSWMPIVALKVHIRFRRAPRAGSTLFTLLDSDSFQIQLRDDFVVAWFAGSPLSYAEISTALDAPTSPRYQAPFGQWTLLEFLHDGFSTIEIRANGQLVAQRTGALSAIAPPSPSGVYIGALSNGDFPLNGQVDDLKVWRLDPRQMDTQFNSRPLDAPTADCWRRFMEALAAAFRNNPRCARETQQTLVRILDRLHRQVLARGPETAHRFREASRRYSGSWREGTLTDPEMQRTVVDLLTWLRLTGTSPQDGAEVATLLRSSCLGELVKALPSLDCDPQVASFIDSIVRALRPETSDDTH